MIKTKKIGILALVAILIAVIVALGCNEWFSGEQNGDSATVVNRQAVFVQNDNDNVNNDVSVRSSIGEYGVISTNVINRVINYEVKAGINDNMRIISLVVGTIDGYTFIGVKAPNGVIKSLSPNSSGRYEMTLPANTDFKTNYTGYYEKDAGTIPLPPDPVREGYTFNGWYMDEACTIPYSGEAITSDTQLYAGWTVNNYTVTFYVDGGEPINSRSIPYNTSISNLPTTTKVGHNFVCWLLNGEEYTNQPIKADTELTARFEKIKYTVNFIVNGEVYKTMQVEFGTSFDVALEKANLKNYTVLAATFENGENADNITSNGILEIREKTFTETLQSNWLNYVVYGGIGIVVFVLLIALFKERA